MKIKFIFTLLFALTALSASAFSWFGLKPDEDDKDEPVRLHRLLEKANTLIEEAEDKALDGDAGGAIDLYRDAIKELERVEQENPERAASPEFTPLRNRKATCLGAIESIRFAQIENNVRSVATTDTTELQKRWNKKHGIKVPSEEKTNTTVKQSPAPEQKPTLEEAVKKQEEAKKKKESEEKKKDTDTVASVTNVKLPPKPLNGTVKDRLVWTLSAIKAEKFIEAENELNKILKKDPSNLQALLLLATSQIGLKSNYAARATLERTIRNHPRSYIAYYNLASLILAMDKSDTVSAKQYYELGRMVGGPPNPALEKQFAKDLKK